MTKVAKALSTYHIHLLILQITYCLQMLIGSSVVFLQILFLLLDQRFRILNYESLPLIFKSKYLSSLECIIIHRLKDCSF